jgi:hypothetical protein
MRGKHISEGGQSMVELALMFTILLLLLAGAVDFGRAFFTWLSLRDAAQEGAAYASIAPENLAEIEERAYANLDEMNIPRADLNVEVQFFGPLCLGSTVQVDVYYPEYPLTMPFLGTVLGHQYIALHATVNDTLLRPSCP